MNSTVVIFPCKSLGMFGLYVGKVSAILCPVIWSKYPLGKDSHYINIVIS